MATDSLSLKSPDAITDRGTVHRSWPMRLWLAAPDWVFRMAGVVFFLTYLLSQSAKYWQTPINQWGPYCEFPNGFRVQMPWVWLLVDLTFLQIALSFCLRIQARERNANPGVIAYTLLTAFAPLIPLWLGPVLGLFDAEWQKLYNAFLWRDSYTWEQAALYGVVMTAGFILEVWGYAVLTRSLSIVPEARELKVTGPYRLVRHPIYLGQFLAQAGFLLIAANTHWVWIGLYILFVGMQLYRSKLEDCVLEEAFGEPYREWQQKTFWFV